MGDGMSASQANYWVSQGNRSPADHVLVHFELKRVVHMETRNVLFLMILQQRDFMKPTLGGRNMPSEQENSAKSGKVGTSMLVSNLADRRQQ